MNFSVKKGKNLRKYRKDKETKQRRRRNELIQNLEKRQFFTKKGLKIGHNLSEV